MKMKRILLAAEEREIGLRVRLHPLLKRGYLTTSNTWSGRCAINELVPPYKPLASTEVRGGKRAPRDHWHLPIVVELPAYLVCDDVPEYTGKVKR